MKFEKNGTTKIASQSKQTYSNKSYAAQVERLTTYKSNIEKLKAKYSPAVLIRLSICSLVAVIILVLIWKTTGPAVGGIIFGVCLIIINKLYTNFSKDE